MLLEQNWSASKHYRSKNSWLHHMGLIIPGKKFRKGAETKLQRRYGDLITEKERIDSLIHACREKEEMVAIDRGLELAKAQSK